MIYIEITLKQNFNAQIKGIVHAWLYLQNANWHKQHDHFSGGDSILLLKGQAITYTCICKLNAHMSTITIHTTHEYYEVTWF